MRWVFHVPIAGDLSALFLAALLYVFTLLSLGLLISTRAQNQMQALQMSMAFILPSVFFSGFIFPRETMPLDLLRHQRRAAGDLFHRADAGDRAARGEPGGLLA